MKEGDWHDTLMLPMLESKDGELTYVGLRIQPGQFSGYGVSRGRCW